MDIFNYTEYKAYLHDSIRQMPKKGHGQARRLAEHLHINSVAVSQVLSGERHFSQEQALQVAEFFGLDALSTDYFVNLVLHERAGTEQLKLYLRHKLEQLKSEARSIKNYLVESKELTESAKSTFYSHWYYSGIRLLSSIEGYNDIESIARYFSLPRAKVAQAISFLVANGLCVESHGKIQMGVTSTHADASTIYSFSHRKNWRIQGLDKMSNAKETDLFFTGPFSLSNDDIIEIRNQLVKLLADISKRVAKSPCESLACLNIDWFQF